MRIRTVGNSVSALATILRCWQRAAMSTKAIEQKLVELAERVKRLEDRERPKPVAKDDWWKVAGTVVPNELTQEAARLGAEWRAKENKRR
jgi:hypothetical protein